MIKLTDDIELRNEIVESLKTNNWFCPCKLNLTPENRCMCEDFRNQESGPCHCGLFVKTLATGLDK